MRLLLLGKGDVGEVRRQCFDMIRRCLCCYDWPILVEGRGMKRSLTIIVAGAAAVSGCAAPALSNHPGYGTPGLSRFVPADEAGSLSALVARCRTPSSPEMAASCAQMHATMHNQPGNTVQIP